MRICETLPIVSVYLPESGDIQPGKVRDAHQAQILTKYGMATSVTPIATRGMVPETKYGKPIRTRPQIRGTIAFCLLPYTKKPNPIELNNKLQRRDDVLLNGGLLILLNKRLYGSAYHTAQG
jgi:hypothetical protein